MSDGWRGSSLGLAVVCLAVCAAGAEDRSIDGSGNNETHPEWGMAGTRLLRLTTVGYGDGVSTPAGLDREGARLISNVIGAQASTTANVLGLSDLHTAWGQFIDHDLDLTPDVGPGTMPLAVPAGDPWFDPDGTGTVELGFTRSQHDPSSGDGPGNPRQQVNVITAFIDGSMIYGSDRTRADALRTKDGTGRLRTSSGDRPPFNVDGLPNANPMSVPDGELFLAGDIRVNENTRLLSLHTLFLREHNRLCAELADEHPDWTGDELYQRARKIVGALLQWVTYHEYLPALLGPDALPEYDGYDDEVDPGIANRFSAVGFRFGHSVVNEIMFRVGDDGEMVPQGHINLRDTFFAPDRFMEVEVGAWLKGGAVMTAQAVDAHIVGSLRNFLFGPPGAGGLDLFALNTQRGRDHGMPDYNQLRVDVGLFPVVSFDEVTSDAAIQAALETAYDDVSDVDPWVAGMAEDHVRDAAIGPLFHAIISDQFTRLRDGDRFWFENDDALTPDDIAAIKATRLAGIIVRNTEITRIQTEVFYAPSDTMATFADLNLDGLVNVVDLVMLIEAWGPVSEHIDLAIADVNGDGEVGATDLVELIISWQTG